jgi:hypothetical protein
LQSKRVGEQATENAPPSTLGTVRMDSHDTHPSPSPKISGASVGSHRLFAQPQVIRFGVTYLHHEQKAAIDERRALLASP